MSFKSKFTPERAAIIIEALKVNPSIPSAAVKAGITDKTIYNWLAKAESGDSAYVEFAQQCATARAVMKDEIVQSLFEISIDRLHPSATKAAHTLLTNLYPTEFANVKHTVAHQAKPEELDLAKLPTDELRAFRRTLLRLRDDVPPEEGAPSSETVINVIEANASTSPKAAN
jgi:hypothetical protein